MILAKTQFFQNHEMFFQKMLNDFGFFPRKRSYMNEYLKFSSKPNLGVKSFLEKQNFGIIDTHASFHKQGHILTRRL